MEAGCCSPYPAALKQMPHRLGLSLPRSLNPGFFHVKVGGLTLSLLEPHSTLVAVRSIFVYPTYRWEDASSGDIALVQLDTPLQSSQFTPVCLPAAKAPLTPGAVCWVTGWGATQERGKGLYLDPVPTPTQGKSCLGDVLPNYGFILAKVPTHGGFGELHPVSRFLPIAQAGKLRLSSHEILEAHRGRQDLNPGP